MDLVTASGWRWQFEIGTEEEPLQTAASVFVRPDGDETLVLKVWPEPGMLAIFRLYEETDIGFDVDLRELQGQQGVDALCTFIRAIGADLASRC
ncbi:MAG: hypothetical protein ACRDNS_16675 [Trebonia sp.]